MGNPLKLPKSQSSPERGKLSGQVSGAPSPNKHHDMLAVAPRCLSGRRSPVWHLALRFLAPCLLPLAADRWMVPASWNTRSDTRTLSTERGPRCLNTTRGLWSGWGWPGRTQHGALGLFHAIENRLLRRLYYYYFELISFPWFAAWGGISSGGRAGWLVTSKVAGSIPLGSS